MQFQVYPILWSMLLAMLLLPGCGGGGDAAPDSTHDELVQFLEENPELHADAEAEEDDYVSE